MAFDLDQPHPETLANFALMEAEPDSVPRYWRLAVETSAYTKRVRDEGALPLGSSWFEVDHAWCVDRVLAPVTDRPEAATFIARWKAWDDEYRRIYERSPKWRLKEMVSQVSETHTFMTWPKRWEQGVWQWAISDPVGECPFDDRNRVLDADFRARLRALVLECDGFLYRCEETSQIVFAPSEDLPRIWAHQDHIADIERQSPFGFFHDMSRPNWRDYTRDLTETEQHLMDVMERRKSKMWRFRRWLGKFSLR